MTFEQLNLIQPILEALKHEEYSTPTPIQAQAIPKILEGNDLIGCAQTGTGKTAAFSIPIIQKLTQNPDSRKHRAVKALIITPTRELAIQIGESFTAYGRFTSLKHAVIFGGVSQVPQVNLLRSGVDILIATPGRLLDLYNQGIIKVPNLDFFVLDEADRMLDMGFIHDIKRILQIIPPKRQTLFFSATMPPEIQKLANTMLYKPLKVEVTPVSSTVDVIKQLVYFVDKNQKKDLLVNLLGNETVESVLVFARTKHGSDKLAKSLVKEGIVTEAIHGNKSQNARQNALNNFKNRKTRVLIATDIAARGIDVDQLSHVINYELPEVPETYVHRIGRTGRAGNSGVAISLVDPEEVKLLKDIERLIKKDIRVVFDHPFVSIASAIGVSKAIDRSKAAPAKGTGYRGNKSNGDFWRRRKLEIKRTTN
jgi:ATP-dependent RNA helicase RhlE